MKNLLTLRCFSQADQPRMLEILTDTTVNQTYMLPDFASKTDAIPLFQRLMSRSKEEMRYVRCIDLDGLCIGFLNDVVIKDEEIEIGYVIHPDSHRKGYMTRALRMAISELFSIGYPKVVCGAFEENPASVRVMEKCDMERIAFTEVIPYRGKDHNCVYYAIEKEKKMLKYPCLILDHDDTVVQSESTVNYPFFVEFLKEYRPGATITEHEYISGCFNPGYGQMCRERFGFTDEELLIEYKGWKEYIRHHIPAPYAGIGQLLQRQKAAGGKIFVVSMSAQENILRDYKTHFGIEPDEVYGWDLEPEHRKPSPWALEQIMANYGFTPEQMLVVDDMKAAVPMARTVGCPIAFAGWGRVEYPEISQEMISLCDYAFDSTEKLEKFLFE